jgi:hypothetical protein
VTVERGQTAAQSASASAHAQSGNCYHRCANNRVIRGKAPEGAEMAPARALSSTRAHALQLLLCWLSSVQPVYHNYLGRREERIRLRHAACPVQLMDNEVR